MSEQPPAAFFRACRAWLDLPHAEAAKLMGVADQTLLAVEHDQEVSNKEQAVVQAFYADQGLIYTRAGQALILLYHAPTS